MSLMQTEYMYLHSFSDCDTSIISIRSRNAMWMWCRFYQKVEELKNLPQIYTYFCGDWKLYVPKAI